MSFQREFIVTALRRMQGVFESVFTTAIQSFWVCQGVCQQARVQAVPQKILILDLVLAAPTLEGCIENFFMAADLDVPIECCQGEEDNVQGLVSSRVVRLPQTLLLNIKRGAVSHHQERLMPFADSRPCCLPLYCRSIVQISNQSNSAMPEHSNNTAMIDIVKWTFKHYQPHVLPNHSASSSRFCLPTW